MESLLDQTLVRVFPGLFSTKIHVYLAHYSQPVKPSYIKNLAKSGNLSVLGNIYAACTLPVGHCCMESSRQTGTGSFSLKGLF